MEDNQNIRLNQNIHFCASCKSENIQKLALAYMSGSSQTKGVGLGVGIGGSIGLGAGMGTNQTLLSNMVAPPKITSPFVGALGIWFLAFFIYTALAVSMPQNMNILSSLLVVIAFVATFWPPIKFYRYLTAKNKTLMEEYNKKYICLRCGNIFKLD
jgi:hypothetical protein